jgi:hypothetical protein
MGKAKQDAPRGKTMAFVSGLTEKLPGTIPPPPASDGEKPFYDN